MSFTSSNPLSCFPKLFRPNSHKSPVRKDQREGRKKKGGSSDSNGDGGTFFLFMRLRKKIFIFRDIFDIPPISCSLSIHEVVTETIDELNRMYPDLMPGYPILKMKEKNTHQGLICLYHVLECMADSWVEDKSMKDKFKKPHIESSPLDKLVELVLEMLDCINKAAKDRFELMDVERKHKHSASFKLKTHSKRSVDCNSNSSRSPSSLSPRTPNSVLPDSPRFADLLGAMLRSYSCHQLLNLKVQAVEELSPMDLKRLVVHVMPHFTANNLNHSLKPASMEEEESKIEAKDNNYSNNNNIVAKEVSAPSSAPPPPPPPSTAAAPQPPMPPLVPGSAPPPPPPVKGKKRQPSPPPGGGMRTVVCSRNKTKLKRSSHMGNMYRNLRGKVEGSCLPGKRSSPANKNVINGNSSNNGSVKGGGGTSMADALAEMTKRSSYFQNIEEDMEKHGNEIKKLQRDLSVFKTNDMDELLRFHNRVESLLEVLTDETQILSKLEGFPMHKLETLRAAASLSTKLNGIVSEIRNWKIEPPLSENLDKVEKYFIKVKAELEGLERTKDEESKLFQSQNIDFDFTIFTKIKEFMVDLSSGFIELALKERKEEKAETNDNKSKTDTSSVKMLWKAFQFAFKVYSFAGGQDERADCLTNELAKEIETHPIEE